MNKEFKRNIDSVFHCAKETFERLEAVNSPKNKNLRRTGKFLNAVFWGLCWGGGIQYDPTEKELPDFYTITDSEVPISIAKVAIGLIAGLTVFKRNLKSDEFYHESIMNQFSHDVNYYRSQAFDDTFEIYKHIEKDGKKFGIVRIKEEYKNKEHPDKVVMNIYNRCKEQILSMNPINDDFIKTTKQDLKLVA